MINLAKKKYVLVDPVIIDELELAGVACIRTKLNQGEVSCTITGKLGRFSFTRLWNYWIARGSNAPLYFSEEFYYDSEIGKRDIWINGSNNEEPPKGVICEWHIKTQEGLNLFAKTIKKYNL